MAIRKFLAFSTASWVAVSFLTVSAQAQQVAQGGTSAQPETVLVTAEKVEENIQDVPIPITVLSGADLVQQNMVRFQDYFSTVPGLSYSPARPQYSTISLRGVSTGSLTNPTVGITIDDVPYGSSTDTGGAAGIPDIDPFDLQRIEVLRGPQGTLYGASAMGGVIKYVTVDPSTDRFSGRLQADVNGVDNAGSPGFGLRGGVNVPITDDFAVRVSAFGREDAGYINNPTLNETAVNKRDSFGGHISALWRPADNFSVKFSALFQDTTADGHPDVIIAPGVGDLQQNYTVPGIGKNRLQVQAYSATADWLIDGITITSVSGYNDNHIRDNADFSGVFAAGAAAVYNNSAPTATPLTFDNRTRKYSEELRALIPIGEHINWTIGGFFTDERSSYAEALLAESVPTGAVVGQAFFLSFPTVYQEKAVFTNLTYKFTDDFDIELGARESHIGQAKDQFSSAFFGPQTPLTASPHQSAGEDAFTYLVSPEYHISSDVMVYARFSSGYRAGGVNPDPLHPQYNPDKTQNYEVGSKGNLFNGLLTFDASLYHVDWSDIQITLVDTVNHLSYSANGGSAKSDGAEVSVQLHPWEGGTIGGWVSYDDAALTQNLPASSSAFGAVGARLPLTQRWSENINFNQDFPIIQDIDGFVGGNVNFVDDRKGNFTADAITPRSNLPAYTQVDLRAGLLMNSWSATLYLTNVGNSRGQLAGGDLLPLNAYTLIQPRTVGVSVVKTF